uniref:Opaque 2 n=1 Tax=Coix lacryma-jobi TaxID=4505 RepID=Q39532_COILA|nr:opaque 2 [Coix lacryma-jobi]
MEHVISMEEILGPFWDLPPSPPPLPLPEQQPLVTDTGSVVIDGVVTQGGGDGEGGDMMGQNTTEWTFERLLEEEILINKTTLVTNSSCSTLNIDPVVEVDQGTMASGAVSAVGDPMEYNAILKRKLEVDLVAFKMWRASSVVNSERSQDSNNHNGGSKNVVQNKLNGEDPINNHAQNVDLRVRLATSSSSRDPSPSDEDMDGEVEILGFKMPTEERVRKRKESNRESARRSRYRKAAHLKELEDQVEQLKAENSCLLRRLAALNQKYNEANVDNRVLRADMETLRAKVKMGEDSLKRVMEMSSLPPSMPIPALPSSSDASVPIQDDIINYFSTTPAADEDAPVDNNSFIIMPMADPLQLVQAEDQPTMGAMELIQKTMGAMPTSPGSALQESQLLGLGPDETINMDMY